jgi:hypothetical protein
LGPFDGCRGALRIGAGRAVRVGDFQESAARMRTAERCSRGRCSPASSQCWPISRRPVKKTIPVSEPASDLFQRRPEANSMKSQSGNVGILRIPLLSLYPAGQTGRSAWRGPRRIATHILIAY